MGKTEIIIAGILFFSLAITVSFLTLIEFVNMDKNPDKYRKPRYKKPVRKAATRAAASKKPMLKKALKNPLPALKKVPNKIGG